MIKPVKEAEAVESLPPLLKEIFADVLQLDKSEL